MEMGKLTQGTNMIKLSNTLTVLERNNDGSNSYILIIKKEEAENYADYWEEQQTINSIEYDIRQLLNKG